MDPRLQMTDCGTRRRKGFRRPDSALCVVPDLSAASVRNLGPVGKGMCGPVMTLTMIAAFAASLFFIACMVGAGLMDLVTMRIRNALVGTMVAAYPLFAALVGLDLATVGTSVAAAVAVFLVAFVLFSLGWIGGGDAKLAVAAVLWLGSGQAGAFAIYTALFGGIFTLALVQFRLLPLAPGWRAPPWIARLHDRRSGVPYGVPMAAAALVAVPHSVWVAVIP